MPTFEVSKNEMFSHTFKSKEPLVPRRRLALYNTGGKNSNVKAVRTTIEDPVPLAD